MQEEVKTKKKNKKEKPKRVKSNYAKQKTQSARLKKPVDVDNEE